MCKHLAFDLYGVSIYSVLMMVMRANQDDPDQQTEYESQQEENKNGLYIDKHMFAPFSL